jgi:hypothetical protein
MKKQTKKIIKKILSITMLLSLMQTLVIPAHAKLIFTNDVFDNEAPIFRIGENLDASSNPLSLEFGSTNTETFAWDDTNSEFDLSDDLHVTGTAIVESAQSTAPLGSTLVTNGTFTTNLTPWTGTNWAHSSDTALHSIGNTAALTQNISVTDSTTYQVELTISGQNNGSVEVDIGGVYIYNFSIYTALSSNATYKRTLVASGTGSQALSITPTSDFDGAIDDVIVKAITGTADPYIVLRDDSVADAVDIRGDSGLLNTFVGQNSGQYITTGGYSTALGTDTLKSNTTGNQNTAIGTHALRLNTTGPSNSALGYSALYSNTTGSSNSALGVQALFNNTTGSNNAAFGLGVLFNNTAGNSNMAIGGSSGYYNQEGSNNAFIGYQAGRGTSNHNKSDSVMIGFRAGYVTHGDDNTFIGYQAGNSVTTGTGNILLGHDVDTPTATTSNYLNIGDAITGDLSSGDITIVGDLAVNGDDLTTDETTTFNLINTNATTLNIGGAATTLNMAGGSGSTGCTINSSGDLNCSGNLEEGGTALEDKYLAFGGYIDNNNPFSPVSDFYIPELYNYFYRSESRFEVSQTGFSAWSVSKPFDNNYDNFNVIDADGTGVITIDVNDKDEYGVNGITYPQGNIYVYIYNDEAPDSVTGRFQDKDSDWHAMTPTDISGGSTKVLWKLSVPSNNYAEVYEITINAGSGNVTRLSEIEYELFRPAGSNMPVVTKYGTNSFYSNQYVNDSNNDTNIILETDGGAYFADKVGIGETSPAHELHVAGTAIVESAQSTAPLGSTLVSNGTFNSDFTDWTATNWTWSSGTADHDTGFTNALSQNISVTDSTTYQVEFTISGRNNGSIEIDIGGVYIYNYGTTKTFTSNSTQKRTLVASGTGSQALSITPTSDFDGALDDVIVKAITGTADPYIILRDDSTADGVEIRGDHGISSVFVGRNSGKYNTDGTYNSALGSDALNSNTTGFWNSALGKGALYTNTTGNYNSAFGSYALRLNTTGSYNAAFGTGALYNNTTGIYNFALGTNALYFNTTSDYNAALGGATLYNTTGGYNTALGAMGGYYNQTGVNNAFIGYQTGRGTALHNKSDSVMIGYKAGYSTHGDDNTFIGYQAGNSVTTGTGNILLGHDVDTPTATTSNYLNIGDAITGDLSSGDITIVGDLAVNGDDLTTDETTTFNLINTNATTLNVGGAATTLNMAGGSGSTGCTINSSGDLTCSGDVTGSGSGYATKALDNLVNVAINESLVSDTDITDDLGTGDVRWNDAWVETLSAGLTDADTLKLRGYDTDSTAYVDILTITTGDASMNALTADLSALVTIGGNAILDATSTVSALTQVGTLSSGAISSGFGAIDIGTSDFTTTGAIGRDTDNEIAWTTNDKLDIRISGATTQIASISTGAGDNDKLVTQGYVDDATGGGAAASLALDNLVNVAINTALLPDAAAADDFGSATLPFKDLFFAGSSGTPGTNNFKITGASTSGTRVITIPDATDTLVGKATTDTFTNKTWDCNGTGNSCSNIDMSADVTGVLPVANGGTNASTASITSFNNITGYTAAGATGTTSTNLVFSTSPTFTTSIDMSAGNILQVDSIYGSTSILPVRIGDAGASSATLNSEDDLEVTGDLGVVGASAFDGALSIATDSGIEVAFANGGGANITADDDFYLLAGTDGTGDLHFGTDNTNSQMVLNSGDVGIGITIPTAKLHIIKDSTYNSEGTAGLAISDATGDADTGMVMGADATNDIFYIQSLDPATSYGTRSLVLNPNGSNVGIGDASPAALLSVGSTSQFQVDTSGDISTSGTLDVTGNVTTAGTVKTTVGGSAGEGSQQLSSELYVQSRGMNLITNGAGLLGNDYNFTSFTFDQTDTHGGKGSFQNSDYGTSVQSDEYLPTDGTKTYKLSLWAKSTTHSVGAHAYFGIVPYDIDNLSVNPQFYMRVANTDTTLAQELAPDDTEIHLTSGTNWYESTLAYKRQIQIFDYENSFGFTYPDYTYSRHISYGSVGYTANGAWAVDGISGNTITLTEPWPESLGTIPIGTAVSNGSSGGTYKYIAASNVDVPDEWTNYTGLIGGWDTDGGGTVNEFPYGTASIRLLFLLNRDVADNVTNVSDLWFSELTSENLDLASAKIWVGDASNIATAVDMSGDASINNTGVVTVANDSHTHSAYATLALDNLASVQINTALLPDAAAADDFGSATLPFKDYFLAGTSGTPGTNNFKITGASTSGTRVITLPDATDTLVGKATTDTFTNKTFDANGTGNSLSNVDMSADVTGVLPVANGGTGATSLTDGGILLGSNTGAITAMGALANGSIVVGDGTTDPVALAAFTSSTGLLKHESGGLELDIGSIGTGDIIAGASAGTLEIIDGGDSADGDILTIQSDGTLAFEAPAGGAEADTLATVTERGAITTTLVELDGGITVDDTNFTVSGTTGAIAAPSIDIASGGYYKYNGVNFVYANIAKDNYFIGEDTGNLTMTGTYNMGMGYRALYINETGATNTAIGAQTLYYNKTGTKNLAIGHQALFWNDDASLNTAIGYQALFDNTSGVSNSAIGESALGNNTDGNYNLAFGRYALLDNTTGSNNVGIGGSAGQNLTTGDGNVFIGASAGLGGTGSNASTNNVVIGADAGKKLDGGAGNIIIGKSAGYTPITGSGNILIGAGGTWLNPAETPATDTNRFLNIGNTIYGLLAAQSAPPFPSGDIGIGEIAPAARLDVKKASATVAIFNRLTSDGIVVDFEKDGTPYGNIAINSGALTYNNFTGSHYGWTDEAIEKGMLVELTGDNHNYHDNPQSEIIYGIVKTSRKNSSSILGSYLAILESTKPASSDNPHLVTAVGNGDVWVVDTGENLKIGDYLISSDVAGHAMKDDESEAVSHIVARLVEPVDWTTVTETTESGQKRKLVSIEFLKFASTNINIDEIIAKMEEQERRLIEIEQKLTEQKANPIAILINENKSQTNDISTGRITFGWW